MNRLTMMAAGFFVGMVGSAYASLDQAIATTGEGAIEFPLGLVKLVGGLLWTVGEVLVLPFNLIF